MGAGKYSRQIPSSSRQQFHPVQVVKDFPALIIKPADAWRSESRPSALARISHNPGELSGLTRWEGDSEFAQDRELLHIHSIRALVSRLVVP